MHKYPLVVWLHDIRSVHNVGSIFRTADAVGVTEMVLSGYTPTPVDRFSRQRRDMAKVSLGAEEIVPWQYLESAEQVITQFRGQGHQFVGLEQSDQSVDYKAYTLAAPTVLLVGNEPEGIPAGIITQMDTVLEIPMYGNKESLNVSVATGIALYRLLDIS